MTFLHVQFIHRNKLERNTYEETESLTVDHKPNAFGRLDQWIVFC